MKHLRLFETQKEYQDGILIGSVSDWPMVTYGQNDDALDYFNAPIVKAKVEMSEGPESPITNHLSIKKLTVDGEIMWNKDTWFKKEYEISQNDFIPDESDNVFIRGQILFKHYDLFNELTMGGKNILIKSDDNATHFLVLVPYDGEYATSHITGDIYNIEEYIDEFSIKKIDDNTYDVSNFYSDFARISPYQHLIILANENEVIPQTLTYERLGTEAENEVQSMEVTQDNVFTNLVNQGFVATIYGEIDMLDYLGVILSINGELLEAAPIPIEQIVGSGLGNLESNKLSFDLSALVTATGELSGITVSYCLLDKEIANTSGESSSDFLSYVKDVTVTWSSFSYITPLPVGQHEVEIELASYKHLPLMNTSVVTEMDLSSLHGQFVDTVGVCSGAKNLTKIIFPENLQNIGMNTLYGCTSLTEIIIPDSVTSISDRAFSFCDSLTSITIPDSVTSLGVQAFFNCGNLTSVNLGNGVTSIGNNAFGYCDNLINVNLGNGVTSIGDGAFGNCNSLTSIVIPNSVTSLGVQAFNNCDSLTSITIPNSVTSIGNYAFASCDNLTDIVILDSITSIGIEAFHNCSGLTSVNLGNGVTSIGERAFYNCISLSSIIIPDSVTSIGENAFYNTPFYNNLPNGDVYLGKCYFKYKGSMPSNTSIVIADGTISICENAFYNRKSLISITIPDSVTSIGNSAFNGCTSLTEVVIPDSVTSIDYNAFMGCDSLTNVIIGNGVTSIGNYAFHACDNLTSVTIGSGVTSISHGAFLSSGKLTEITCYATTAPTLSDSVFGHISDNGVLRVPSGSDYSSWLSALPSGWVVEYI